MVSFRINSEEVSFEGDPGTPLLWVIRDHLQLLGTKFGCGIGQCGACTVHVDGAAQRSCVIPVSTIDGRSITTIEGLAPSEDALHPVQQAFIDELAPQCGYCTPGQIMSAVALLKENPNPTREEARQALSGNLCRCGAYDHYLNAVMAASKAMRTAGQVA